MCVIKTGWWLGILIVFPRFYIVRAAVDSANISLLSNFDFTANVSKLLISSLARFPCVSLTRDSNHMCFSIAD